jgi:hypothetical protein
MLQDELLQDYGVVEIVQRNANSRYGRVKCPEILRSVQDDSVEHAIAGVTESVKTARHLA